MRFEISSHSLGGFPGGPTGVVKNPPANTGGIRHMGLMPGLGRSPEEQPTPVFLPGESQG